MLCGIDIGGTKIETAIFTADMTLVLNWRVDTPTQDYATFLNCVSEQIFEADRVAQTLCAVGIGLPGLRDAQGHSLSVNVPCANNQHVGRDLANRINREIYIENDCRCFALSEAQTGAGRGFSRVYGAILGTGAAGGFCINGRLSNGRNHLVGEYGHVPLPAQLAWQHCLPVFPCGCGLSGCLEQYISGKGLTRLYEYVTGESLTTRQIISNMRQQQPQANIVFSIFLDLLGYAIANIIHSYDPDIIVLGGGLSNVPEILQQLPCSVQAFTLPIVTLPPIVQALHGDASGVRGAALLTL